MWQAARWASWLPRDAVTYLAMAEERAIEEQPKKPDVSSGLAAMREREAQRALTNLKRKEGAG